MIVERSFGWVIQLAVLAYPVTAGSAIVGYQSRPILEMSVMPLAPGVGVRVDPMLVQIFLALELPLAGVAIIFVVASRMKSLAVRYRFYSTCRNTHYGILELQSGELNLMQIY